MCLESRSHDWHLTNRLDLLFSCTPQCVYNYTFCTFTHNYLTRTHTHAYLLTSNQKHFDDFSYAGGSKYYRERDPGQSNPKHHQQAHIFLWNVRQLANGFIHEQPKTWNGTAKISLQSEKEALVVLHTLNIQSSAHEILCAILHVVVLVISLGHDTNACSFSEYILLNWEMASNECERGGAKTIEDCHYGSYGRRPPR